MTVSVECDASDLVRAMDGIAEELAERTLPNAMRLIGETAVRMAVDGAPNVTSRLAGSIASLTGRDGSTYWVQIGTNVEYAPYVEFGTGQRGSATYVDRNGESHTADVVFRDDWKGMAPHPYIRPAVYDKMDVYRSMIADALRRAAR